MIFFTGQQKQQRREREKRDGDANGILTANHAMGSTTIQYMEESLL
jgi:hypothetical protein